VAKERIWSYLQIADIFKLTYAYDPRSTSLLCNYSFIFERGWN
jgi:hypothetical protein